MPAPRNRTRANIVQASGLHDADGLDGVPFGGFAEARNTDVTRQGFPIRRPGRVRIFNAGVREVWGDGSILLFVTATGDLRQLNADETTTLLRAGLPSFGTLAAARVANTVYWSCGALQGVIVQGLNRTWGLPQLAPAGHVLLSAGQPIPAGRYRYAWVGIASGGEESPIGARGGFELSTPQAVSLVPPIIVHDRIINVRAYVSEPDGTQLYRLDEILAPADTAEQASRHIVVTPSMALVTPQREDLQSFPASSALSVHNGRLVGAVDRFLVYSERFDYEFYAPQRMFIPFSSTVTTIAPVDRGVFVGTETDQYFLLGADLSSATLEHKASYGAVANTVGYLEQKEHGFEGATGRVAVWTGVRGPVFGLPSGEIEDSGDGRVRFPGNIVAGVGAVRKTGADAHYVSVMRCRGD